MNFFDKFITAVSPRRGYEREAWRQALEVLRGYDAAGWQRLNSGWHADNESAEITDRYDRDILRARARDLERNSDIAQSVIHAFKRNVVGKGFKLQAKTGVDELNDQLEALWRQWVKPQNCDVTGMQSFNQLIRMAVVRKKVDGGILIVKCYTPDGLIPFKLQMVEVDELDITAATPRHQGNRVIGGIEYDNRHRAVGYFIQQYDPEGWKVTEPVYVEAKDVIRYWTKNRPSQLREVSDLAPTMTRIRDANEFITAVAVKERIAACVGLIIKRALPTGGFGRGNGASAGQRESYDGKMISPGMIKELNAGDDVVVVDPKSAGTDSAAFLKTEIALIASGQGLSYEAVSRDMSKSTYSSARQSANEDEDTFAEDIELLTEIMSEIYETFVISCYLAGLVDIPDFWENKAKYMSHVWVKSPKKWIDPVKESNATKTALSTAQKTLQDVAAEQGKDWKEVINEISDVLNYGNALGVDMGGVIFGKSAETAGGKSAEADESADDE